MQVFVRFFALAGLLVLPALASAQTTEIARVEAALARGDADALTALCADRVDVSLRGSATMTYSRAQVRYVLAGFLESDPPTAFAFEHRMTSGDAELVSGRYYTDGHTYQVMARFGRHDEGWEIRELRIDG